MHFAVGLALGCLLTSPSRGQTTVTCLAVSPTECRVAVGCSDGSVRQFDAATGESLCIVHLCVDPVTRIDWSPSGEALVAATVRSALVDLLGAEVRGQDETNFTFTVTTATWHYINATSGAQRVLFASKGGQQVQLGCAWRPDGKAIVTWGIGRGATWCETARVSQPVQLVPSASGSITSATWTVDGRMLLTGDSAGTIQALDAETGDLVSSASTNMQSIRILHAAANGMRVDVGGSSVAVGSWTLPLLELRWTGPPIEDGLPYTALGAHGEDKEERELFAATDNAWSICHWSPDTGKPSWLFEAAGHSPSGFFIATDPEGEFIATWDSTKKLLRLRRIGSGVVLSRVEHTDIEAGVQGMAWTADGRFLVVRTTGVRVFDGRTWRLLYTWYPEGWLIRSAD